MDRAKMPRINRAAQFAPFDALKGLQDALRIKEYEHEKIEKGEISEQQAERLSKILISIEKNQVGEVVYFLDGHYKTLKGKIKLSIAERLIFVDGFKINLDDVTEIQLIEK